jgi:hypothetical protein
MLRKPLAICIPVMLAIALAATANTPPSAPTPSAAEIVENNVAARGGLQAWRSVQTMSMTGKMGVGGNQRSTLPVESPIPGHKITPQMLPARPSEEVQLPFLMELARIRKTRIELQFRGQTALQVYDGSNGWKVRPFLNRLDVEPFTADELKKASNQADLDGPLVDYAAKGTRVELEGTEKVEDRDAYKLKLTPKTGEPFHVWIDAKTFLEIKIEGQPRQLDGVLHPVEVYYRDYRAVSGLQVPFVLETKVLPVTPRMATSYPTEKIVIEKVVVNPKLEASLFAKPQAVAVPTAPAPKVVK